MKGYSIDWYHKGKEVKRAVGNYAAESHNHAIILFGSEMNLGFQSCSKQEATHGVRMTAPNMLPCKWYELIVP